MHFEIIMGKYETVTEQWPNGDPWRPGQSPPDHSIRRSPEV